MNVAQRHPEMYALARANAAAEGRYLPHPSQLSGTTTIPATDNIEGCREIAKVINKIYLANYGGTVAGFATGRYLANRYKDNASFFNEAGTYVVSLLSHIATTSLVGPHGPLGIILFTGAMDKCLEDANILAALKEENKALFYNIYAEKILEYGAIAYSAYKGYQKGDIASAIGYAIGAMINPAGMAGMASTIDK